MTHSSITSAITKDGSARILYADTTAVVERARKIHQTSKTMTAALGRVLTAAAIMGAMLKDERGSITLQFKGDGPGGGILCTADAGGRVRGYADNPGVELLPNKDGKLDVGGAVGKGMLYVIRDMGMGEPYVGTSPIVTGEIAEDITEYYAKSEQTATVCALGVRVFPEGSCKAAGGFILQLLPFADEGVIPKLEENIAAIPSVSALVSEGMSPNDVIGRVFAGLGYDILEEREIDYVCNCSRERYAAAIAHLDVSEIREMAEENRPIEACCHFCNTRYTFDGQELRAILEAAQNRRDSNKKE